MSVRKFRKVGTHWNPMAVCSKCDRDATQTQMTRYCIQVIEDKPFVCDECHD